MTSLKANSLFHNLKSVKSSLQAQVRQYMFSKQESARENDRAWKNQIWKRMEVEGAEMLFVEVAWAVFNEIPIDELETIAVQYNENYYW